MLTEDKEQMAFRVVTLIYAECLFTMTANSPIDALSIQNTHFAFCIAVWCPVSEVDSLRTAIRGF